MPVYKELGMAFIRLDDKNHAEFYRFESILNILDIYI